jgi:hypothetical protein
VKQMATLKVVGPLSTHAWVGNHSPHPHKRPLTMTATTDFDTEPQKFRHTSVANGFLKPIPIFRFDCQPPPSIRPEFYRTRPDTFR